MFEITNYLNYMSTAVPRFQMHQNQFQNEFTLMPNVSILFYSNKFCFRNTLKKDRKKKQVPIPALNCIHYKTIVSISVTVQVEFSGCEPRLSFYSERPFFVLSFSTVPLSHKFQIVFYLIPLHSIQKDFRHLFVSVAFRNSFINGFPFTMYYLHMYSKECNICLNRYELKIQ